MASLNGLSLGSSAASPDAPNLIDDFDARCLRIRRRLLDSIDATLDELEQPDDPIAAQRDAIARAVRIHTAPLFCRNARCRRARICRRTPCSAGVSALSLNDL